jgi:hypothetical protein
MASEVNRRTADGGRFLSFRGVITELLLTQPLLAVSGTFGGRCQPEAAPNTHPRVSHQVIQHDATTAGFPQRIDYFQDVLDLEPGQLWEEELYRRIDECDLFLLFWSASARELEWVRREVVRALERQGPDR